MTNKMANTEEDEELYENLKRDPKLHRYDEITINFGKPVILANHHNNSSIGSESSSVVDLFHSISFTSPIEDLKIPPIPAPRLSKQKFVIPNPTTSDILDHSDQVPEKKEISSNQLNIQQELENNVTCTIPTPTPRNVYETIDEENITDDDEDVNDQYHRYSYIPEVDDTTSEENLEEQLGARPKINTKSDTIDIRHKIASWYDEASDEIERDLSLDLSVLEEDEELMMPGGRHRIRTSAPTLLRDFDPILHESDESETELRSPQQEIFRPRQQQILSAPSVSRKNDNDENNQNEYYSAKDDLKQNSSSSNHHGLEQDAAAEKNNDRSENFYVTVPCLNNTSSPMTSSPRSSAPPCSPPPPLPQSEPPVMPQTPVSYENIWIDPNNKVPVFYNNSSSPISRKNNDNVKNNVDNQNNSSNNSSPPPVPPRRPSFLNRTNDDSAISSSASSSSNDVHTLSSCGTSTNSPQRSASLLNLNLPNLTKFASNIKRKMSDHQHIVLQTPKSNCRPNSHTTSSSNSTSTSSSSSCGITTPLTSRQSHFDTSSIRSKTKSGVLYIYLKSRRALQLKWCTLDHGHLKYFNDKQMVAIPKESIPLASIVCLRKHEGIAYDPHQVPVYTFTVSYLSSNNSKHQEITLGAASPSERDKWLDILVQSLDYKLTGMHNASRLSSVQLKTGFAGIWHKSWISLEYFEDNSSNSNSKKVSHLKYTEDLGLNHSVDLKKVKNLTLVKEVKNLATPLSHNLPVLVLDCLDRSLYIQSLSQKSGSSLKDAIEQVAFSNTKDLNDLQLTSEDIPVIVDKCISFVYGHGCMTEGIYRHAGVHAKISKLLVMFQSNAWAVHLNRDNFSEHDVANALKRFFRTLNEPLLTERLRPLFLQAAAIDDSAKKLGRYRNLVQLLPPINYNTLKKLMAHLVAISSHAGKNLMPNYNLGAIWGPSLLTVDKMEASTFAQTSNESDVCRDLIDYYKILFDVPEEELKREAKISQVLEKINQHDRGRCLLKQSGDLRLWVYIDDKSSGNCVCVVVKPTMTALEMTQKVLDEKNLCSDFVLHEMVLGGALQRPIHHSEHVLDVTLKWGSWGETDRRDNYLLLKKNILFEEAVKNAKSPWRMAADTAYYSDLKSKSYKKYILNMNNARLSINKTVDLELASWPIEDLSWYLGSEPKRQAPFSFNMTFILRSDNVIRSKERPHFGRTISFESRESYIKWIAAMMVAEHANDFLNNVINTDSGASTEEKLLLID